MNHIQKQRLFLIIALLIGLALATTLILFALKKNINVFLTPSQLTSQQYNNNYAFRLGGMIKTGSVKRAAKGLQVQFIVTDLKKDLIVQYEGILPDLFREGTGVVVEGKLNAKGEMMATQVLAKHDENYMPANVYQAMRRNAEEKTPS